MLRSSPATAGSATAVIAGESRTAHFYCTPVSFIFKDMLHVYIIIKQWLLHLKHCFVASKLRLHMVLAVSVVQLSERQIKTLHSTDIPLWETVSLERGYVRCLTIVWVPCAFKCAQMCLNGSHLQYVVVLSNYAVDLSLFLSCFK